MENRQTNWFVGEFDKFNFPTVTIGFELFSNDKRSTYCDYQ